MIDENPKPGTGSVELLDEQSAQALPSWHPIAPAHIGRSEGLQIFEKMTVPFRSIQEAVDAIATGLVPASATVYVDANPTGAVLDVQGVAEHLTRLFANAKPRVLEELLKLVTDLPDGLWRSFLHHFLIGAEIAMEGTAHDVIGVRLRLPGSADELLTALLAYKRSKEF